MKIKVNYRSVDRCNINRTFSTIEGARAFAIKYVGKFPEIGCGYAVSGDGVGKVTVSGDATVETLFRETKVDKTPAPNFDEIEF